MRQLPHFLFDVYALSLPRGHGFGDCPPVEAWLPTSLNASKPSFNTFQRNCWLERGNEPRN